MRPPDERVDDAHARTRLVIPLDVVPQQCPLILRRVDPVDPRAPLLRCHRSGRSHHDHRHAIAPGVKDAHEAVHQSHIAMQYAGHRPVGRLCIAMRDRHYVVLVQAKQHLRRAIAQVVHETVVEAAIAGAGIQGDVGDVKATQHLRRNIAFPFDLAIGIDNLFRSLHSFHDAAVRQERTRDIGPAITGCQTLSAVRRTGSEIEAGNPAASSSGRPAGPRSSLQNRAARRHGNR